jgi:hypothetical protein
MQFRSFANGRPTVRGCGDCSEHAAKEPGRGLVRVIFDKFRLNYALLDVRFARERRPTCAFASEGMREGRSCRPFVQVFPATTSPRQAEQSAALVCSGTRSPRSSAKSKGDANRRSLRFPRGAKGFPLLTTRLPKLKLASGNISRRMMSPGQLGHGASATRSGRTQVSIDSGR